MRVSYVSVVPETVAAAASNLANLGSTISAANAAAAAPTTSVLAAAQDEVSTAIAALFGSHAHQFQALSAKAAAFHDQFVQALTGGAASYVKAEAANVLGLMSGSQAGALGAAAAAGGPAAFDVGSIFNFLGEIAPATEKFLDQLTPKLEADFKAAELAARDLRSKQLVAKGLRILAKDGAILYTDGKEILAVGGRYPFLYSPDFIYARKFITDAWGVTPQTLNTLLQSEIHVFARSEGLAQNFFQKVGNQIYQIETNAQGTVINKFLTTEAIFKRWVAMTANGPRLRV
ncbi:hypothetical protein Mkiyose1665_25520 [Mycobacterium kiyosense]|uniref:PE domain-containing protein n=1 Tax=Mycobacterium kiyosense TaxID=2871094 RepID=A0A9P3UX62_9MYCO|nr:hypothetical protein MKCMC460_51880 [Mycobacterium sp. 20KCMC460]GLB82804.1 hypothetical protein SRL2020028_20600 [Mycobacterium kiyosense]GLB89457.1 hypothetical protein SRL2020130_22740 [Mycobacterium kiyosense]GLB94955.1 hypothetical protein SRL2020226_17310 [Mycobacterium kiyosense]GLC00383.1 hypothetical protein SRL2020400_09740 [Mycobacterium kiyosense]